MNKMLRNFWLDVMLYLLVGTNITLVTLSPEVTAGSHPGPAWHLHAILGILMTVGCLVHIVWHWRWFAAVLTGKAKGRIKLIMNSLVIVAMVIANVSGHALLASGTASRLHSLTGTFALIGMSVHAIKHMGWMATMTKKLIADGNQKKVIQSA